MKKLPIIKEKRRKKILMELFSKDTKGNREGIMGFVALRLVNIVVRDWASTDCLEKSLFKAINII